MNDSFLEEIGLVEQPTKPGYVVRDAERHITRRSHSQGLVVSAEQSEWDLLLKHQKSPESYPSTTIPKPSGLSFQEIRTPSSHRPSNSVNNKPIKNSPGSQTQNSVKKFRVDDGKLKLIENNKIQGNKSRSKVNEFSKESSRLSDESSKENDRSSDLSAEGINNSDNSKERNRSTNDMIKKKINSNSGVESLAMLNAIKEVVSSYTKIESGKIMTMMQNLYINSQSNLMKQMLILSDDIKEQNLDTNSSRFQMLVQENAKLLENVAFFRNRVEELQKSQEDVDKLRQENSMLKMRLREYEK